MSSYFDDASLVMIPSGYKTSKVYSVKPTDGTGDLTFTRSNDTATRVASNGLIERVRTNKMLQSNTFNTSWTISGTGTVTTGATDPFGGTTAWTLAKTATSTFLFQSTAGFSGSNTFSIYAKAGTVDQLWLNHAQSGPFSSFFDLTLGTTIGAAGCVATIVSVGGGWFRCSIAGTVTSPINLRIYPASGGFVTGTTGNILIYAAQAETGDIATEPILTTSAAVSVGPVANVPRLDYLGSSCPRLILEPQRQNVCLWSEQINNAGWTKSNAPTITTNIATAPDGYGGADGIQDTTGGTFKRVQQLFSVTANSTNTASVFVKKETTQTNFGGLQLAYVGGTTKYAYGIVNPIAGTIVVSSDSVIGATSTKVEDYGDWWRFSLTATDNGSNTTLEIAYYGTLSTNGTTATLGAGSVRTVWGFQVEIGASYATSYIPTLGAAVTRGADAASKTGISSLIGQTEGTLFAEVGEFPKEFNGRVLCISDGTTSNYVIILKNGLIDNFNVLVLNGGVVQVSFNGTGSLSNNSKIAVGYANNDCAIYVNGNQVHTDTSASVPTCSNVYVGQRENGSATFIAGGSVAQALLFKTRLTNQELQDLTTL